MRLRFWGEYCSTIYKRFRGVKLGKRCIEGFALLRNYTLLLLTPFGFFQLDTQFGTKSSSFQKWFSKGDAFVPEVDSWLSLVIP